MTKIIHGITVGSGGEIKNTHTLSIPKDKNPIIEVVKLKLKGLIGDRECFVYWRDHIHTLNHLVGGTRQ